MKIYTRTGDDGSTGLFGGGRVPKDHLRVEAYGTLDELNAVLGLALAQGPHPVTEAFRPVQAELLTLGALAATPREAKAYATLAPPQVAWVSRLELAIDAWEAGLAPLKTFILPGGSARAAALHHARTVCRRAERACVALSRQAELEPLLLVYLNRLSDALFVAARAANAAEGVADTPWTG